VLLNPLSWKKFLNTFWECSCKLIVYSPCLHSPLKTAQSLLLFSSRTKMMKISPSWLQSNFSSDG
jgi:hypothetical protein